MPALHCARCKIAVGMNVATSRVRFLTPAGKTVEIMTKTLYCPACRSFELWDDRMPAGTREMQQPKDGRKKSASRRSAGAERKPAAGHSMKPLFALISIFLLISCSTVPITHRHQLDLIPASTMLPMSFNQYQDFLSKHKVIENTPEAQMVQRVGTRIQNAVERYFAQNKLSDELKGYKWEFHLVEDKQANAFCMPGGKVVVYSGILPITRDENGLAVVLGHEISHAVAKHGDERMSQGLIAEMGGVALSVALAQKPSQTQQLFMTAYGAGAEVGVLLPYSRLQESEADHLGLIFMAMAGYDARGAVDFWERMIQAQHGQAPPVFLSDHPADQKRVEDIKKSMPEAMKYYQA